MRENWEGGGREDRLKRIGEEEEEEEVVERLADCLRVKLRDLRVLREFVFHNLLIF